MKDFLKLIFFGISKSPRLDMSNPANGEKKAMPFGFNLQFLLLAGFFGLPLFFKQLWGWAWMMFCLSTVQFVFFYLRLTKILSATTLEEYYAFRESDPIEDVMSGFILLLALLLSIKGNEWAVKRLLKKGWRFDHPEAPDVQRAAKKWNLSKHYLKPIKESEKL